MKHVFRLFMLGTLLLLLTSCAGSVSVKTDYDPEFNFNQFQTFRWIEEDIPDNVLDSYPLVKKRIKASVIKDLESKGFTLQESGEPDFGIAAHGGTKEKTQVHTWGGAGYYGYDPWWGPYGGPYGGQIDVSYYTEGTLIIDVVDVKGKELVWRGIGTGVLRDYSDNEKRQQATDETIMKIMKDFPPQKAQ